MKSPDQVTADITGHLQRTWPAAVAVPAASTWPRRFPLGAITRSELEANFEGVAKRVQRWYQWIRAHRDAGIDIDLETTTRRVSGTNQTIPTHTTVGTIDSAARIVGDGWPARLARHRDRCDALRRHFPDLPDGEVARTLREAATYSDVDFQLLCDTAVWFQTHRATGLTPRQVPIPGIHAKWLNTSQHLVQRLAGLDTLGLAPAHPARVHLTYLDPVYRAAGGRIHDVAAIGDSMRPAYFPQLIVISENKDTAVGFPETPNAIAIEGDGKAGPPAICQLSWVRECPHLRYWGDIDAEGFEIVNSYRAAGLPIETFLMDDETYRRYMHFGARHDRKGNPIAIRARRDLRLLTPSERHIYQTLTSPDLNDPPRLEQERVPLSDAVAALKASMASRQ
jgi:hypothetical protein